MNLFECAGVAEPDAIIVPNGERFCAECRVCYPLAFFTRNLVLDASNTRRHRPTCKGCEQERRDAVKAEDRFVGKARDTTRRHAVKYKLAVADFVRKYGWDLDRVAHLLRHAYENTCVYCRRPYADMGHGAADVTMDIYDRAAEPYLDTNTRVCCSTCNREKSTMPPNAWALQLLCWRKWEAAQQRRKGMLT